MRRCEVCGASDPEPVLESERLDGPLVRCRECGLLYVGRREHDYSFSTLDRDRLEALAERVRELDLVDHEVEDAELPWRRLVHEERLAALRRHEPGRRLVDFGCATGDFLADAAAAGFEARGVEADPGTAQRAREKTGLPVITGTLEQTEFDPGSLDVATLWHVIEHLDSPRRALEHLHGLLAPGALLGIETPAADTIWRPLLRSRWRQLIPDHYFLFTTTTLPRLLHATGFEVLELRKTGKPMSGRFLADRLRRVHPALGAAGRRAVALTRSSERTVRVNLGDIMLVVARRVEAGG